MPTPDEWYREVNDALFGADVDVLSQPDQPGSLHFPRSPESEPERRVVDVDAVDTALFGAASAVTAPGAPPEPVAPPQLLDQGDWETFADAGEAGDDEVVDEDYGEAIVAEPADVEGPEAPAGTERSRRRALVLAGLTALLVIFGAAAGAVIVGRSGDSEPGRKTVSEQTSLTTTTTTPVSTITPPPTTSAPAPSTPSPAPTPPRAPATSSRGTVPPPREPVAAPQPPPPPPPEPPPEPPPTSPPPTTPST